MDATGCQGCRERDAIIAELRERVAALEAIVRELQGSIKDLSGKQQPRPAGEQPDAPAKKPTGRKPGGQPGHKPLLIAVENFTTFAASHAPLPHSIFSPQIPFTMCLGDLWRKNAASDPGWVVNFWPRKW